MRATELSTSQAPRKVRVASREHQRSRDPALLPSSLPSSLYPELASGWISLVHLLVCFGFGVFVCLFVFLTYVRKWWEESAGWEETQAISPVVIWLQNSYFISMSSSPLLRPLMSLSSSISQRHYRMRTSFLSCFSLNQACLSFPMNHPSLYPSTNLILFWRLERSKRWMQTI